MTSIEFLAEAERLVVDFRVKRSSYVACPPPVDRAGADHREGLLRASNGAEKAIIDLFAMILGQPTAS